MTILRLLENIRTPFGEQFFQLLTYFGEELLVIVVICSLYCASIRRRHIALD